jgi:hypothetical protein
MAKGYWPCAMGQGSEERENNFKFLVLNFEVLKRLESFIQNPKFDPYRLSPIAYCP